MARPGDRSKRPPTMTDVARMVGVSQTTVSFVLNNVAGSNISEETRERVLEAVKKLSYRPNAAAKALRTSKSHTIGFITDDIATTPFAGNIIKGAQDMAWSNDKLLMIINTSNNPEIAEAAIEMMLERQVEAIMYATWRHMIVEPPPNLYEVPAVLLDCFCADRSLPSVVPDEVGGGRTATEVLLRKGHRRVGYITLAYRPEMQAFVRLEGYKTALASYGIPFDPALVRTGTSTAVGGYSETLELMKLPDPPTAIFCANDRTAMGAYDALKELGLSIPRDVAVIGFDNQEIISAFLRPGLSTLALPHYQMGQWAVEYLLSHRGTQEISEPPEQKTIECPVVMRESV
jgi:LacI family transcriptional regulator